MTKTNRIEWLSLLRGLNILLVVMYHVQLIDMNTGENHIFCTEICRPFNAIRMPLFIFCSGALLYLSRIQKQWEVKSLYIDKFYRIVCPFLFFVTFYYFLKVALSSVTKTKVVFSIGHFLESFAIYYEHPSAHLWFLAVLFWFMLLYPFFIWLCKNNVRMECFLLFVTSIYFIDLDKYVSSNWFYLFNLNKYLVFFYFGIFFFRFEFYRYTDNIICLLFILLLYFLCYWYNVPLFTSLVGILLMISICQRLSHYYPTLFCSFREYIYQIFLMSFIFQPIVELILWQRLLYNENYFYFFYLLNVSVGIMMPVFVSKLVEKYGFLWLKICLGLKYN